MSETNRCGRCKLDRPIEEFAPSHRSTVGAWCKACRRAQYSETHEAPPSACAFCGGPIENPHGKKLHCSRECRARAWQASRRKATEPRACRRCGIDITDSAPQRRFCSTSCAARYRTAHNPERERGWRLSRNYGITLDRYDEMLAEQGGGCAICGTADPGTHHGFWHVDHCHDSDAVRGLLCNGCNLGLGKFYDRPELLEAAALYIEESLCTPKPTNGSASAP